MASFTSGVIKAYVLSEDDAAMIAALLREFALAEAHAKGPAYCRDCFYGIDKHAEGCPVQRALALLGGDNATQS